jgi:hypothetical protein
MMVIHPDVQADLFSTKHSAGFLGLAIDLLRHQSCLIAKPHS